MFNKKLIKKSLSIIVAFSSILVMSPMIIKADDGITEIKIYHTNDIHGRAIEAFNSDGELTNIGFGRFKTFVQEDSKNVDGYLVLDAGDTYHGQPFANFEEGESVARLVKSVGYDAIAIGNHDFNFGREKLHTLLEMSNIAGLAGNVKNENGEVEYESTFIKEIDGVKIGVFGIASNETPYKTSPSNVIGLDFGTDEQIIEDAKEMVRSLEEQNCDIIVGLTHVGDSDETTLKSTDIAKQVDGIDLIIDGHSHTDMDDYEKVDGTIITSVGEYFEHVGVVEIKYDNKNDKLIEMNTNQIDAIEFQDIEKDKEISDIVNEVKSRQEEILQTVIGNTPNLLDGDRDSVRYGHTNLGNLLTDAMVYDSGAEIAITNGGGIRASINEGDITKGDVLTVLPFGNYITTIEVSGENIINALEHGFTVGAGKFPHYSGMEVMVEEIVTDESTTYKVESVLVNGEKLQNDRIYTVATNDFMAVGGDGYEIFIDCKKTGDYSSLDESLIKYIEDFGDEGINKASNLDRLTFKTLTDIDGHWASSQINEFVQSGYINGYEDNTFKPNESTTRAEFVKIVNSVFNYTEKSSKEFDDVKSGSWYFDEVSKAVKAGYIDGYEDNTFRPNDIITREEASKIVATIKDLKGDGVIDFKDTNSISNWAVEYVDALNDNDIVNGYEDNTFRPKNGLSRAEAVTILSRAI